MKRLSISFVSFFFIPIYLFTQSYCVPVPDSTNLYISNVQIGSININSLNEGYSDRSATDSTIVNYGSNPISITVVGASLSFLDDQYVYIDWNNDFVFDLSESFYFATSINVATSVSPGSYRMRIAVAVHDTQHGAPFPCLTDTGEVEDYTLIVTNTSAIVQNNLLDKNIVIYPNPGTGLFTITGIENIKKIDIYELSGRLLQTTNSTTISIENYAKGIYVFKVAYEDRVEDVKVVID